MNSKFSKHLKKKVETFDMGQKIGTASSSQSSSCSILCVDEDVKFVVDDDSKFSTAVPVDKNIELSQRTYSKKNPLTYPMITPPSQNPGRFEFSVFSGLKSLTSETLKRVTKVKPQVKRKLNGKLDTSLPVKSVKREINDTYKSSSQSSFTKAMKVTRCKTKSEYIDSDVSCDSDIEVIEEVIVNPNALNLKPRNLSSRKPVHSQSFSNNKKLKNISETPTKKSETKPLLPHSSKTCFRDDFIEADTAPYMPNNPNLFPEVLCMSDSPVKWIDSSNSSINNSQNSDSSISRKKFPLRSSDKPLCLLESKQSKSDRYLSSRELKNLYENLNEISWTHKNSFKKLLRNPDYIRHSDRGIGRIAKTDKRPKQAKSAVLKRKKAQCLKKSPTQQASLKKTKLAKATTNKKLSKLNPNKMPKLAKGNKLASKQKANLIIELNNSPVDDKSKITKISPKVIKTSPVDLEKLNHVKGNKKSLLTGHEKSKNKDKCDTSKVDTKTKNEGKEKIVFPKEKAQLLAKPKIETSEASSSGMQNTCSGSDLSFYNAFKYSKETNLKKFIQQGGLDAKHFKMIKSGYKKDERMFTTMRKGSQCRVQIEPLEHTNLWNTEYYEEFRKQFLHQTFLKAMEKRDQNCIMVMLQEICDSYMMPAADENKSKKKKHDEEALRSSARQSEWAFRYKEIVVRKMQSYMQVILVPNVAKKNALSIDAIKELRDAFLLAKKDTKCKAVLINSGGSYFCTGIDLSQLVGSNKKQACDEMASVIRELVLVLASFSKPVVAAVNGDTAGFGISLLTYCDVVLASDKATFCIPNARLGYMPEGGLTVTLPQVIGNTRGVDLLLYGKQLTASQAQEMGLVSDVFWPSHLMHEAIPRIETLIAQPKQVMEATKLLVRANLWDRLKTHLDFERQLLVCQWLSPCCQEKIKRFMKGETPFE